MKKVITAATVTVAAIFAIGGSWITDIAPPEETEWGVGFSVGLATVIAVALAIVLPLLANAIPKPSRKIVLAWIGGCCLVLTVGSAIMYWQSLQEKTVIYPENEEGIRVVIGSEFTDNAEKRIGQNPALGTDTVELMSEFEGLADNVWTSDSISTNQFSLVRSYLLTSGLMSGCFLCLAFAGVETPPTLAHQQSDESDV